MTYNGIEIKTTYDPKPIPDHRADWEAWLKGQEDEDMLIGYGISRYQAIADLLQQLLEQE